MIGSLAECLSCCAPLGRKHCRYILRQAYLIRAPHLCGFVLRIVYSCIWFYAFLPPFRAQFPIPLAFPTFSCAYHPARSYACRRCQPPRCLPVVTALPFTRLLYTTFNATLVLVLFVGSYRVPVVLLRFFVTRLCLAGSVTRCSCCVPPPRAAFVCRALPFLRSPYAVITAFLPRLADCCIRAAHCLTTAVYLQRHFAFFYCLPLPFTMVLTGSLFCHAAHLRSLFFFATFTFALTYAPVHA